MAVAAPEKAEPKIIEATKNFILDSTYRCDRCSAQAYVMVTLMNDGVLTFCRHHAHKYEAALKPLAFSWYSEEVRLNEDRKKGSEN